MKNEKIEKLFVDFILNLVGPNEERENDRNKKYSLVKKIIEDSLKVHYPNYIPYIFPYGSFPIKTYLKESDIDITMIFENKTNHQILINLTNDIINNIIFIIKDSFENYNNQNNQNIFTDINIINADIKLIKCQIQSIPLDISLNNFYGLFKMIFMNNIYKQIEIKFNNNQNTDNKLTIFKKTILLIKAWCTEEGNLMGSNIGLMASYALESLIIHMFNLYYKDINNEIEGFFYFFNLMNNIDLENNIISLFGIIPVTDFQSKLLNSNINNNFNNLLNIIFSDKINENNKYLFDINEIKELLIKINNSPINPNANINKDENLFKKVFQKKLVNIFDQINIGNNLGKSINYHSFSKMKNAFKYMINEIKNINKIKQMVDPFLYINSLFKLFNNTLNMNFIGLFINYLNETKIIVDSKKDESNINNIGNNLLIKNKEEIKKFNKLFIIQNDKDNDNTDDNKLNDEIDSNDENEEDENDEIKDEEEELEKEEDIKNNDDKIKYENYDIIINYEIINKLYDLNKIKNNNSQNNFFDNLNKVSLELFYDLEKFMIKNQLI